MKSYSRLVKKQDEVVGAIFGRLLYLVLDAIDPDEKTKEPNKAVTSLAKRRAYTAISPVSDAKVEIWSIIVRRFVFRIWFDIDFNLNIFMLLPKLQDLIREINRYSFELRLEG